jgi:N-acetylmuramoyl-L-alanine amidase
MREIKKIIVHCSDTPDTMNIGVNEIRDWHIIRGFDDVGYHFVIKRDGTIEKGRPLEQMGAHVAGHNLDSIGICWVGRDDPSAKQWRALPKKLHKLCRTFGLTAEDIYGHKDFTKSKTCPNLDMGDVRERVRQCGLSEETKNHTDRTPSLLRSLLNLSTYLLSKLNQKT